MSSFSFFEAIAGFAEVCAQVATAAIVIALPAWWCLRRFRSDPLLRLTLSALVSPVLLFLVEVPTWVPGVPRWIPVVFAVTMVLTSAAALAGELRRGERAGGPALAGWMAASLLLVGGAALIVAHGLPEVFFDWYEHYVQSLVFLEHRPLETTIGPWSMAARGPLFNATCARFLEVVGRDDYAAYQVGAIVLNATVALPLALLVRDLAGFPERRAIALQPR